MTCFMVYCCSFCIRCSSMPRKGPTSPSQQGPHEFHERETKTVDIRADGSTVKRKKLSVKRKPDETVTAKEEQNQ